VFRRVQVALCDQHRFLPADWSSQKLESNVPIQSEETSMGGTVFVRLHQQSFGIRYLTEVGYSVGRECFEILRSKYVVVRGDYRIG
jgi:hypothetical protein